jgi:hypothetical protein
VVVFEIDNELLSALGRGVSIACCLGILKCAAKSYTVTILLLIRSLALDVVIETLAKVYFLCAEELLLLYSGFRAFCS